MRQIPEEIFICDSGDCSIGTHVVNSRNTLQQRKGILGEVNDNQAVGIVPYVGIGFRHKVGEKIRILSYVS